MRLIEKVWFEQHSAKWILVPLLAPLSLLFALLTFVRRIFYRHGIFTSHKVKVPVIVVGNIGIGGNGKTPVVISLIEQCQQLGLKAGVVSRGYGGKAPYYPYVLDEKSTAAEAGDEPVLIFSRCKVPVVVGSERVVAANKLVDLGCDVIIADDGLQHYKLQRDLELIVVDAKRKFGNGFLLPAGPLREGKWRLNTVDFVIQNWANVASLNSDAANVPNQFDMELVPEFICNIVTGEKLVISDFLRDNPNVNAMAGIGDPKRFFSTLQSCGFTLNEALPFVDHHKFSADDIRYLASDVPLLMTEKDAVKCNNIAQNNWWYMPVTARFSEIAKQQLKNKIQALTLGKH